MKTISPAFSAALDSLSPAYKKKIILYPRTWSASLNKYTEAAPIDITKYLIEISPVKWKLDNEGYSVWNTATTTLTFTNLQKLFTPGNSTGFFPAEGDIIYGSRIEIHTGAACAGGAQPEFVKIFQGFIYSAPIEQEEEKTVSVTLSGELAKLDSFSALDISMLAEGELTGQDEGIEFTTANPAVGSIIKVNRGLLSAGLSAALELNEEDDYQISSLNSNTQGAKIKLTRALNLGEAIWVDYRYWHTDKPLDWIARKVAEIAGIENADIDPIAYKNNVEYSFIQPANAAFTEGEFKETAEESGQVILPDNYLKTVNYDWTILEQPSKVTFTFTPSSVMLSQNPFQGYGTVCAPATQAYGTWEVEANCNWMKMECQFNYFISTTNNRTTTCGYAFSTYRYDWYYVHELYRIDNGKRTWIAECILQYNRDDVNRYRYRISRNKNGEFRLWTKPINDRLAPTWHDYGLIVTDNTYTECNYNMVVMELYGYNFIYEIQTSPSPATGTGYICPSGSYLSPVIDGGETLESWGPFSYSQDVPAGCSGNTFWRAKPQQDAPWSDWHAIASGIVPQTESRYMQLKWAANSDAAQTITPKLNSWQLAWTGTGFNIAIVNTGGMSCLDVIRELAQLTGYQIGFDTEGKFLFKQRSSGEPMQTLSTADIINIESISDGTDKIYNRVTVNFGNYSRSLDSLTLSEPRPNLIDKYGVKELTLSSGALLPPQNANLARAAAPAVYDYVSRIKKRAVIVTKFMPHIELNDILAVNCPQLALNMRVDGIEFNLNDWTLRLDLTEV